MDGFGDHNFWLRKIGNQIACPKKKARDIVVLFIGCVFFKLSISFYNAKFIQPSFIMVLSSCMLLFELGHERVEPWGYQKATKNGRSFFLSISNPSAILGSLGDAITTSHPSSVPNANLSANPLQSTSHPSSVLIANLSANPLQSTSHPSSVLIANLSANPLQSTSHASLVPIANLSANPLQTAQVKVDFLSCCYSTYPWVQ